MRILGSCQCKAVQYEVTEIDGPMWNCFCQTCRKSHAADHNTAAKVKSEHFHLLSGQGQLKAFESTPGKLRWFCGTCGSHVYAERPANPEFKVLRAGTFDTDPGSVPELNVWFSHAKPWLQHDTSKPTHDEFA
ncbi:GFA family protein [Sinorhizobium sp. GL28]|uniref:GFA family protein n=1 Tax=Sinorhizobium sp. GL28 TaxID=1358418 RepID=UPI00071C417C|nr:GFA family protein [Sinorhizobium sp. GL28]KSV85438.1 aldehyde-activating protein [Sinorhizobium sp. GL28]